MIIISARASIKAPVFKKYIPNLETEAALESVSCNIGTRTIQPIRGLRSRAIKGIYRGARVPVSVTFNFATNSTIAQKYFTKVIDDLSVVSGGLFRGEIPSFSFAPFVPIAISSATWSQQAGAVPAQYSITMEYFHLDIDNANAVPLEASIYSLSDTEYELDLRDNNDIPLESYVYSIASQFDATRTLDGYFGIRYGIVNLNLTYEYYDDAFVYTNIFAAKTNQSLSFEEESSNISVGGKLLYRKSITAPLIPSTDNTLISNLSIFNASN